VTADEALAFIEFLASEPYCNDMNMGVDWRLGLARGFCDRIRLTSKGDRCLAFSLVYII